MVTKGSQNVLDSKMFYQLGGFHDKKKIYLIDIVATPKKKKMTRKKKLKNK
jgi:hypothetical protein